MTPAQLSDLLIAVTVLQKQLKELNDQMAQLAVQAAGAATAPLVIDEECGFLSVQEAADKIGVSKTLITDLISEGSLRAGRFGKIGASGQREGIRVSIRSLNDFVQANLIPAK